jgi:type IV pilus assembly protein PilN
MIRINLLPVRQVKKVQAGQRQLLFFFMILVAEMVVMFLLYEWKQGEVESKRRSTANLRTEIEALKKQVGDFDQLKAQRDRLIAQRDVINSLQKARTGPVWMMRELSDILTQGKGPTVDQAKYEMLLRNNPSAGYNSRWNPNRLWIDSFTEKGGAVRISGKAKDYDDVAEFNKRLIHSTFFRDEYLERNDQIMETSMGLKVVKFSIRCRTTY